MVAITQAFPQPQERPGESPEHGGAIAKLKLLHAEAEETARLANLLGRSLYAGIALPILSYLTVGLTYETGPASQLAWCALVTAVAAAMVVAYRRAMRRPFERASLKEFAKDLSAILLFAGFAWGAGAFLALPVAASAVGAVVFTAVPALLVAYLLRDREALLLFLAPIAGFTAAAALLKPFAGGLLLSAAILLVGGTIFAAAMLSKRLAGDTGKPAMLSLP
jgi:hypothetical protein